LIGVEGKGVAFGFRSKEKIKERLSGRRVDAGGEASGEKKNVIEKKRKIERPRRGGG